MQPREEKRSGTGERLPRLCEAVQEDVRARGHSQQVPSGPSCSAPAWRWPCRERAAQGSTRLGLAPGWW